MTSPLPASLAAQARAHGLPPGAVRYRLRAGWSLAKALTTPLRRHSVLADLPSRTVVQDLRTLRNPVLAARYGVSYSAVRYWRQRLGIPSPRRGRLTQAEKGGNTSGAGNVSGAPPKLQRAP